MKLTFKPQLSLLTAVITAAVWSANISAQGYTYRYVNDEGVRVMSNTIPPELVNNGYEILSPTGRVIRVVEPEVPPELAEIERKKAAERAEFKRRYEQLARRYSSTDEIEAAKQRRLVHVEASILLAESSVENVQKEIDDVMGTAADFERAGKPVPQSVMDALKLLDEKMSATKAIRKARYSEKQDIVDRFEADKVLFLDGKKAFAPNS